MRRLMFFAGAAVGYVLGARAGRERYEQLRDTAKRLVRSPAVRNTVDAAALAGRHGAARAAGVVADRANGRLPGPVIERLRVVEHRAGGPAGNGGG